MPLITISPLILPRVMEIGINNINDDDKSNIS